MFINLIYYALVNSNIVYTKLGNDILLLNFKIVVAKALIGRYINLKNLLPTSGSGEQISHEPSMPREVLTYTHEFQKKRIRMPLLQERRLRSQNFCILSNMSPVLMLD